LANGQESQPGASSTQAPWPLIHLLRIDTLSSLISDVTGLVSRI
jgi:hypothetical protein